MTSSFQQDPLLAYDDSLAALFALSTMVAGLMDSGDDHSAISYGVSVLFDQQFGVLNSARSLIHESVKAPNSVSEAGIRRVEPAGINMVMVTEPDGRRYMTTPALAGVEPAGATPFRVDESPMEIRKRVIAGLASDGEAAGDIAQAMGLKKETVEKVIGQLVARQTAAADGPATDSSPDLAANG